MPSSPCSLSSKNNYRPKHLPRQILDRDSERLVRVAIAHKIKLRDRLVVLVRAMGIKSAQELSAGLMLLVDGAFVQRRLYRVHQVQLQQAAARLIQAYGAGFSS